jgi:hypothetical protein
MREIPAPIAEPLFHHLLVFGAADGDREKGNIRPTKTNSPRTEEI